MPDRIVIDTGPLITLARANLLKVVSVLPGEFFCPEEVMEEIAKGVALGYPDARAAWLQAVALSKPLSALAVATLDVGEAAVIQLAMELGIKWVCMDERKGRLAAEAVGLSVTGTLGLLARAKKTGVISVLRPHIDKLMEIGAFYDEKLIRLVLESVGEKSTGSRTGAGKS